jgi:hypothetical protein
LFVLECHPTYLGGDVGSNKTRMSLPRVALVVAANQITWKKSTRLAAETKSFLYDNRSNTRHNAKSVCAHTGREDYYINQIPPTHNSHHRIERIYQILQNKGEFFL